MISWIIIGIIVVLAILVLKMNHFKHRTWVIIIILLALFLYISITVVNNKNDLKFNSTEGVFSSIKVYFGWLANGFQNLKVITGNALRLDWTSTNKTFFDKKPVEPEKK